MKHLPILLFLVVPTHCFFVYFHNKCKDEFGVEITLYPLGEVKMCPRSFFRRPSVCFARTKLQLKPGETLKSQSFKPEDGVSLQTYHPNGLPFGDIAVFFEPDYETGQIEYGMSIDGEPTYYEMRMLLKPRNRRSDTIACAHTDYDCDCKVIGKPGYAELMQAGMAANTVDYDLTFCSS